MPVERVSPKQWRELVSENGSIYIGPPAKKDPLLDRLLSVKQWPVDLREPDDEWFYSDQNGRPIGPVSIDALIAVLRQRSDPLNSLVWTKDGQFCGPAKDVPQIAESIFRSPTNGST